MSYKVECWTMKKVNTRNEKDMWQDSPGSYLEQCVKRMDRYCETFKMASFKMIGTSQVNECGEFNKKSLIQQ